MRSLPRTTLLKTSTAWTTETELPSLHLRKAIKMDPLSIPLAFGCILTFSHIDLAMTKEDGDVSEGVYYKRATLTDAHGHRRVLEPPVRGKGLSPGAHFDAGSSPDRQFASYITLTRAAGHNVGEVSFVSAKTCAPIRFVNLRDGLTVDAASYRGWAEASPHTVLVWEGKPKDGNALPIDEAKALNPAILDVE